VPRPAAGVGEPVALLVGQLQAAPGLDADGGPGACSRSASRLCKIFRESSATLLAEISNLKTIISRFNEFSRMPQPQLQLVQMNDVIHGVLQLFQAQLESPGRRRISCDLQLDQRLEPIPADPELLHRAISNLMLTPAQDA